MTNPASKIARFKRKLEGAEEKPSKKQKVEDKKEKPKSKESSETKKKTANMKVITVEEDTTNKLNFVLPEDDDFVEPVKPAPKKSKANLPKPVRTYSRSERAKSRKRPEDEEKERLQVLSKFKKNTETTSQPQQTQTAETTDGVEKFTTEAPKLLTDEKPVTSKAKPSPSNSNKGIFANAKYSKLIQKKGSVKDPGHKEENFIDSTEQYNPYNLATTASNNNNLEKEMKTESVVEKPADDKKEPKKIKAKQTLEYVRKTRSELQEKMAGSQTKLKKDIMRLINAINPNILSESAEVELRATQSCVEASSRVLQSLSMLTDSLAMAQPIDIPSDHDMFHGSVFTYSQALAPIQSRSAPNLPFNEESWSNQFLPMDSIQLETPKKDGAEAFDPSVFFN